MKGFPTISDRCANGFISQSVSLAHAASGETLSEWTRTPTRKKNMYVNIQHQLNHNSKRNVT